MVGASLMVRSLLKMQAVDIGVRSNNVIAMTVALSNAKYPMPSDRTNFTERLTEQLGSMPDLESFTVASHVPAGGSTRRPLKLEGRDVADQNGRPPSVVSLVVTPGYFHALGLTMLRGREFVVTDGAPGAEAAIVNQRFAAQYWPGEEPLGKRIQLADGAWATVVGVSPRIVQWGISQDMEASAYIPYRQLPLNYYNILVKTRTPMETVVRKLREQIAQMDPDLPLFNIRSLDEIVSRLSIRSRILGVMFTVFALIGLILASVGIYAVAAYSANRRTQEIGVRMALGAGNRHVLWLVLRSGFEQLAIALPIGLACAFGVTRLLRVALFQVTPLDPLTFIAIPVLLVCIVFAACLSPAWRASRLNPVDALRTE
jgi:predicted permease